MLLVDTNVLVDVLQDDPQWAEWSIGQLRAQARLHQLAINPVIYAEISLSFSTLEALDEALDGSAHTAARVALDEGQDLLLGLSHAGRIVGQQPVVHHPQMLTEVRLVEGHLAQHPQVGISHLEELVEPLQRACLPVIAADFHISGVDDQLRLPQKGPRTHLQITQPLCVLEALGVQDALDRLLLRVAVLPDVLLRALMHGEILHEACIGRQHHAQLVATHALHPLERNVVEVVR